jgi:hypothetical protein
MPRFAPFGYSRHLVTLTVPFTGFLNTTNQVNFMLSKSVPFTCELERIEAVTTVVGTGAGATRTLNVRNGSATGTIAGLVTVTLSNQGTLGTVTAGTVNVASNANKFGAGDTLTVEFITAGATAFSAGGFDLVLTFRDKNQSAV